jgi:hypothetical protein
MSWYDYIPSPALQIGNLASGGTPFGVSGSDIKNYLVGGDATKGMATGPQTGDYQRAFLQNDFMNRQAPQVGAPNYGQANATAGQQGQLAQMLFRTASGQQPGPGELAVQRGVNNAMAQQTSAAQMARGANAALAARTAARSTADIGVNGAGQRGIAQMQDVNNAQGQLAGLLGTQRWQDLSQTGQQIGVAQGNQQAQMGQQQLQLSALAQMLGVDQAALQQDLARRGLKLQDQGHLASMLQQAGTAAVAAASDSNLKTDVTDAREDIDEMLSALAPVAYRYKDEAKYGEGRRAGIMAQDLQKSEAGRAIVVDLPDGAGIGFEPIKAISMALASLARLNERLSDLEKRIGGR